MRVVRVLLVGIGAAALAGCGGDDSVERYAVTGQITFQGKPVPAGEISFQPNKGNTGPGALAKFVDGVYKVDLIAGSHEARIVGLDGPPIRGAGPAPGERVPKPLFPEFTSDFEVSKEASTKDFDVPAK